jgi:hypothetical protein
VAWGLAAVLLIVLWVRSYYRADKIWRINSVADSGVESEGGLLSYWHRTDVAGANGFSWHHDVVYPGTPVYQFAYTNERQVFAIIIPTWLPLIVIAPLGAVSWVRRFTTRTLLLVMTDVGVVLGLIMWAAGK